VGFTNAVYHWPAFPGDTFTRTFTIKSRRSTSDSLQSLFTFACVLRNQRGRVIFTCDQTMLFPFPLEGKDSELSTVHTRPA
jgi:acyl dehydratase